MLYLSGCVRNGTWRCQSMLIIQSIATRNPGLSWSMADPTFDSAVCLIMGTSGGPSGGCRRDTRKYSSFMMSKATNTMKSPRFWDAQAGILSRSYTRRDSGFEGFCRRRFGVARERNANQRADRLFQNVKAMNSSVPKSDYAGSSRASVLGKHQTAGKKELLPRTETKLQMNS